MAATKTTKIKTNTKPAAKASGKSKPAANKTAKTLKTASKSIVKITKDMTIGDAVQNHPETAFVMMKHGLHCVGCHVAAWETIEQGCMGHGMDDKQVKTMVDEMNQAVEMMKKNKK